MQLLFLLALLAFANKGGGSSLNGKPARRQVKGESGKTWFVEQSNGRFGVDQTSVLVFCVFASASAESRDLVIAYMQLPEAIVHFPDGERVKSEPGARALFYASPSTLTKDAIADFIDKE